jgi:hypothetical protein
MSAPKSFLSHFVAINTQTNSSSSHHKLILHSSCLVPARVLDVVTRVVRVTIRISHAVPPLMSITSRSNSPHSCDLPQLLSLHSRIPSFILSFPQHRHHLPFPSAARPLSQTQMQCLHVLMAQRLLHIILLLPWILRFATGKATTTMVA